MNIEDTMTFSIDKERYEYHYRKKRRKMVRLIIALCLWLIVIIYLLTPFSSYKMMNVKGNIVFSLKSFLRFTGKPNVVIPNDFLSRNLNCKSPTKNEKSRMKKFSV